MLSLVERIFHFLADGKSAAAAMIGIAISPFVALLETYVFGDMATIWFLFVLVGIDTALGVRLAIRNRDLSSAAFARVLDKLLVYLSLLAAAFAVAGMGGADTNSLMFHALRWLVVSYIFVREFLSIVEKAHKLGVGLPDWIVQPLRDYAARGTSRPNSNEL